MIDSLLAEAGLARSALDGLAFGRGPGSFTGVRIACGVVQGLALGLDLPVAPVSSLAALAQGAYRERAQTTVAAAIDARMGEVYWGAYRLDDQGVMQLQGEEAVLKPQQVRLADASGADWFGAGSGWASYGEALRAACGAQLHAAEGAAYPFAEDLLPAAVLAFQTGQTVVAEQALPVYLRNQVVRG